MIRFDGMEFDTVEELVAYKKAMAGTIAVTVQPKIFVPPPPVVAVVEKKEVVSKSPVKIAKNSRKYQIWTAEEDDMIRDAYLRKGNLTEKGKLHQGVMKKLAKSLGRTPESVAVRASIIGATCYNGEVVSPKKVKDPVEEAVVPFLKEAPKYMIKKHPDKIVSDDQKKMKLASGQTLKEPILDEFPRFSKIGEPQHEILENVLKHMVANHGKLMMFDMKYISLEDGQPWNGHIWREFVYEVMDKSDKLSVFFGVPNKFRMDTSTGYHVLVYD